MKNEKETPKVLRDAEEMAFKAEGLKTFEEKDRERLIEMGYVIYPIGDESIKSIRATAKQFFGTWYPGTYPSFELETSTQTEAAINPYELYLPDSNWKTLDEQIALMDSYSQNLVQREGLGVKAIIGQSSDYIELLFKHLALTREQLAGQQLGFGYIRTMSKLTDKQHVHLANFHKDYDALIGYDWDVNYGHKDVYVTPLIIPS